MFSDSSKITNPIFMKVQSQNKDVITNKTKINYSDEDKHVNYLAQALIEAEFKSNFLYENFCCKGATSNIATKMTKVEELLY